jgi:hypothetical protein
MSETYQLTGQDLLPTPEEVGERLLSEIRYLENQENTITQMTGNDVFVQQRQQLERQSFDGDWSFNLTPNWNLKLSDPDKPRSIGRDDFDDNLAVGVIGGKIRVSDSQFDDYSFNFSILVEEESEQRGSESTVECPCCWEDCEKDFRVARRYHFDIDIGDNDNAPKPISHLQIGGKFKEDAVRGYSPHYCLSPLDKPRIPYPPMDPALIFNMISTQYYPVKSSIQESWQSVVRKSEKILWNPYHQNLASEYRSDGNQRLFSDIISNSSSEGV